MPKIGKDLLSVKEIESTKHEDKTKLLRDGSGLFLVIEPSGKKWWKMRTVLTGKHNSFSLGGLS